MFRDFVGLDPRRMAPAAKHGHRAGEPRTAANGDVTMYRGPRLAGPFRTGLGPDGAAWYADHWNSTVGRVSDSGEIQAFQPGVGRSEEGTTTDVAPGADGRLWFTDWANNIVGAMHVAQLGEAR